jgi:DNA repair protein RecO
MISCIAKGARMPKNKFGSSLQPLSFSQISYYKKPTSDLFLLSKSETIEAMNGIINSYEKLNIGLAVLESLSLTQIQHEPNEEIFFLIKDVLTALNKADENFYNYFVKFQLDLYKIIGYSISFSYFDLDKTIKSDFYKLEFHTGEFGEGRLSNGGFTLNAKTAGYLKQINATPVDALSSVWLDNSLVKAMNTMFAMYIGYHLDKKIKFKTLEFYTENDL